MYRAWCFFGFGLLLAVALCQSMSRPKFFDRAIVEHLDSQVRVQANAASPLYQAVTGIRWEYGWQINFEAAPLYSHFELVDDTGPKWRAAHPDAKGVTRPNGGIFTTFFPEPTASGLEEGVLRKVISDYNSTENPGRYMLLANSPTEFTVVGTEVRDDSGAFQKVSPLMDTRIFLPKATRSFADTVSSILTALQSASGKRVLNATFGQPFPGTKVTLGGDDGPAREILRQALASSGRPIQYDLLYDADVQTYGITFSLPAKYQDDGVGGRRLIPIDQLPRDPK